MAAISKQWEIFKAEYFSGFVGIGSRFVNNSPPWLVIR